MEIADIYDLDKNIVLPYFAVGSFPNMNPAAMDPLDYIAKRASSLCWKALAWWRWETGVSWGKVMKVKTERGQRKNNWKGEDI